MKTNIEINDKLMAAAQKLSNIKTKKSIIEEALKLYIAIGNQKELANLWGKIELDDKAFK